MTHSAETGAPNRSGHQQPTGGTSTGLPVIGKHRDEALASGAPFPVAALALDPADLDELWDGLERKGWRTWSRMPS